MPPQRVRVRDKDGKQRALLKAATEVFAEFGYDAAPTKEIARRAGCSESLIFRYFVDKQGIFEQVVSAQVARAVEEAEGELVRSLPATMPEFIEQLFAIRPPPDPNGAVADWEIAGRGLSDPGFARRAFLPHHRARVAFITQGVRHYQELGQVDDAIDPEALAELLASLTIYTTTHHPRTFGTDESVTRAQIELAVQVLTRGSRPTSATPNDWRDRRRTRAAARETGQLKPV